ncbi:ThuA domain-containing protein [Salipaludibacillus agaradhaerens]|jgi:trehalose utilization protein|uniref:ThuA domain-containing protein n=1 Tax=Salipaludibacillus agaradhaerens TaxID=76935 RepID=A0A9Q4B473_SALAG|nr:ThuA domain-containing protein [Salipaludibacillus agaradhaerens]MCR6098024.1 ThuA domain-containing protein [Salipaludibacillus agaradhaerens]MCR6116347.1 ThuA domain-containing protein [Salipaludibacillus agaradhaerens]
MVKVTVWNENRHEQKNPLVRDIYPEGIHGAIVHFLKEDFEVITATLDDDEHGLTDDVLNETDVLLWWGHMAHEEVDDAVVAKVKQRVLSGMGLIVLHSGHFSKIFKSLMGTTCDLKWREAGEKERLWVIDPSHQIAEGIGNYIELEKEEMYGEHFDIPPPEEVLFLSWFEGGEVFRSGCTYRRGKGKVFYFRPGHETYPTYYHKDIQQVIKNAVQWAIPTKRVKPVYGNAKPLEGIKN